VQPRLATNTGRKNRQKFAIWAPWHKCVRLRLRNKGTCRQSEENLFNSSISPTCSHNMANFSPLAAEIGSAVWGTPATFNGFRVLLSLLQRRRSPEANQTLHDVWPSPGLVDYFRGLLSGAKFTLRPSLAFAYIGSVTARHSSSGHQPDFAALCKEWTYGTFAEGATYIRQGGHHVSIGPHSSYA